MPVLRTRGSGARQRATDATMRVSDAERAEVADQLAQHYGDGRLDQAELDERLSRAMSAKTRADLTGITDDLPEVSADARARPASPARPRARPGAVGRGCCRSCCSSRWWPSPGTAWLRSGPGRGSASGSVPWLWIALLVFCWLRFGPRRHRQ